MLFGISSFVKHFEIRHHEIWWIGHYVDPRRLGLCDNRSNLYVLVLLLYRFAHHIYNIGDDGGIDAAIVGSAEVAGGVCVGVDPQA